MRIELVRNNALLNEHCCLCGERFRAPPLLPCLTCEYGDGESADWLRRESTHPTPNTNVAGYVCEFCAVRDGKSLAAVIRLRIDLMRAQLAHDEELAASFERGEVELPGPVEVERQEIIAVLFRILLAKVALFTCHLVESHGEQAYSVSCDVSTRK